MHPTLGDIAQLGERGVRYAEVGGSSPPITTTPCEKSEEFGHGLDKLMHPHEILIYYAQGDNSITTYPNPKVFI